MRESTSSKEPPSSPSDHERSFERTRDSYIACINRSLDHAFEFLSETGYASAGYSDAERVESRSEDELERSHSDFVSEINIGLKQCGVREIGLSHGIAHEVIKEVRLGQLWGPRSKSTVMNGSTKGTAENGILNVRQDISDTEYLNSKNRMRTVEEQDTAKKSQKKIIVYQHVSMDNTRKNRSKSMENIGPKYAGKSREMRARKSNGVTGFVGDNEHSGKENSTPKSKLHEREDSGYESKAEMRNGIHVNGDREDLFEKRNGRITPAQRTIQIHRQEMTPYLTTEREIFKQLLTNAKESEQIENKHRRRSRSLSNLDLRRAASKISLGPAPRSRPVPKTVQNEKKGFRKLRESFRRTTSYFLPQKFAFQEEKDSEGDFTNALEFQYHCMRDSRDGSEPITSTKNLDGKKKGFFKSIFERKKNKPRLKRYFKSTEAITQSRWQSRENLNKNERKGKSERPISMLTDKLSEHTEKKHFHSSLQTVNDEKSQARRNSLKGSRFRRCESLRSIPSPSYSSEFNDYILRTTDVAEPFRARRSGRNRPMSVHGALFRAMSVDASEDGADSTDYQNLHRVLRNRLSCCSINNGLAHNLADHRMSLDRMSFDSRGTHDDVFTSSSPRKNDDITEWIRGLQFSSVDKSRRNHDCFKEEQEIDLIEEENLLQNSSDGCDSFHPETRIINGQKQTYL